MSLAQSRQSVCACRVLRPLGTRGYYYNKKPYEHEYRHGFGMLDPWASNKNLQLYQRYRALYKQTLLLNSIFRFKHAFEEEALQNRLRHVLKNGMPESDAEKQQLLEACKPQDTLLSKPHQTFYEPSPLAKKKKRRKFRTL